METSLKHKFTHYVSLSVFGMMAISCYILADTFFVAQGIGSSGLTALNLAIPMYSFIHGTGLMIGMGGATRFALTKSKTIFTQALFFTGMMSILFVFMGICFSSRLAVLLGADELTFPNTAIYLKTILCFSPMFLLNNLMLCFVRNDKNPKLSMMAMMIGSLSNIILDYVFVFPMNMGMFGAAFATGIAPIISLLVLLPHFLKRQNTFHVEKTSHHLSAFQDITKLGISALITEFSSGIVIIVFNIIILKLEGNIGVAAYGIIANIALVIISIFTGIAQGIQPLLSDRYRLKCYHDCKKIMRYAFVCAATISLFIYSITFMFSEQIISIFNSEANVQLMSIAIIGMRLYFIGFFFIGLNILCIAYFGAIDHTKYAFIISILRGFVIILLMAFLLAYLFQMQGVWLAMTITEMLVLILSIMLVLILSIYLFKRETTIKVS